MKEQEETQLNETWETPEIRVIDLNDGTKGGGTIYSGDFTSFS
nr:hypothetical protein [uncultured Draconibacterium sp.]